MDLKLSIIVPIYKVEAYLSRCISALLEQDIPSNEYEIICVNDGSPDNCREIVKEFQEKHSNIVLIDQENKGVSVARNAGLKVARAKYVLFIDADDYIEHNTLRKKIQIVEQQKYQVAFLGFTILDENGVANKEVHYESFSNDIISGNEAYYITHGEGSSDPDRIYAVILEREFLMNNSLFFTPGVPYLEDGELLTRILCIAERCMFISGPFYLRTTRPGSATNSDLFISKQAIDGFIKSAINLANFKENAGRSDSQRIFLNQPIVKYVILAFSAAFSSKDIKYFSYVCRSFKNNGLKRLDLSGCKLMYRRLGIAYNISGYLLYTYLLFRPVGHHLKRVFSFRK
jgi:glycosyltransferase involved in cell wall biosynthesis